MVTIRDVAQRAGVNHTTVSHALSGKRPVASATRDRVLEAVRVLGYQPNATARSLVSRRTRTVGLIAPLDSHVPALSDSHYSQFITSVADHLSAHDYRLLCFVAREPNAADIVQFARSGQVDGILLLQVRVDDPRVNAMRNEHLPFVTIGRPRRTAGLMRADADFAAAGEIAVRHLVDLGHRQIAFLGVSPQNMPLLGFQYYGLAGFRRAHRSLGLPLTHGQVLAHSAEGGMQEALAPLYRREIGSTALIATTPVEAVMALHVLAAHGWNVPDDLSIVALNDSMLTQLAQPPITVVTFSPTELTAVAVNLLLDMLEGKPNARQEHLVPVDLIVRQSTRPISLPVRSVQVAEPSSM